MDDMSWRATAVSLLTQLAITLGGSAAAAALWSARNGEAWLAMLANCLLIAGALWLIAGGGLMPKMTSFGYTRWGLGVEPRSLTGDDVGARATSRLTPFGESLVVGGITIGLAVVLL